MKKILLGLMMIMCMGFTGCFEGVKNSVARDGGFFATSKGDYIVINTSGNRVLDIYKLKDRFVNNQENTDGVGFIDNNGDYVLIVGDVKVIRVSHPSTWDRYEEYHFDEEFASGL